MMDKEKVQEAVRNLLVALGEDVTRPGLVETPKRVAGYWEELLEGENYTNKEIADMFRKDFQVSYDSMVIKEGVVA
jgi:GTP cyclohydrolase I